MISLIKSAGVMTTAITISIKYAYLLFLVKKLGVSIPNDVRNATITGNSKSIAIGIVVLMTNDK